MKKVIIYSTLICPYCIKAKHLLESKGIDYQEVRIDKHPELIAEVVKKSGGQKTVPQIFINDYHVGGCDDLYAFDKKGQLDSLLDITSP
ncbi:MAG: glutaredoxin 3 [Deltaproteobacteria bacterium]|nr:glutaredoxin 3 [Deltaproteobacteria bacterium]